MFCLIVWLYSFLSVASCHVSRAHEIQHVVDTGYAQYLGQYSFPNTVSYLGLPYAEPPLGKLRFRKPLPLNTTRLREEHNGVIDARSYPNFCVQGGRDGLAGGAGTEDCLKVNIYSPVGTSRDAKLPVLVFLHGGGYIFGNPRNFPFEHWIQEFPNVIIVSVYYRLNSLGFLAHPDFLSDVDLGDLNVGFLDQIEALKWVRKYIDTFGGDPEQVTIDGHSAGASSVELHLVAGGIDNNTPLFSRAIAQSVYRVPLPRPEQQEPLFNFYANNAGCGNGSIRDKMSCLRSVPVYALARAQDLAITPAFDGKYNIFRPVVDGVVIRDYPTKLIMSGEFRDVPLLIGATSNETSINQMPAAEGLNFLFPGLNDKDIEEFLHLYPAEDFSSTYQHFQVMTGESVFICSVPLIADAFARRRNDVWTYRYNEPNPTKRSPVVAHSAESWMMFNGTNTGNNGTSTFTPLGPDDELFSEELIAYWLSFVREGNPNVHKRDYSPAWHKYAPGASGSIGGHVEANVQTPFVDDFGTQIQQKQRMVLQKRTSDPFFDAYRLQKSGCFMETLPEAEHGRCVFVGEKVEKEQN
ncbi:alpha/beta-hydrolase [Dendrothele bispora CBS 962.96]|uniref:Carboxylic ester hydrolase n=1 Tax=Dendrothele bispora (strain CBS 962.96) TaxID=1314807 RepID=A0A4S8KW08_DENBC|nr:alpha/beta-hydrolase [Dendrothele bispora CBS 962.96]